MANSTIDLLLKRRSVLAKNLIEPGPSPEELQSILSAALRIPDHGRAEPWKIQILDKEAQSSLGDFCAELFNSENPDSKETHIELERNRPQRSPILLIITMCPNEKKLAKIPEVEQLLSTGAMCQNILVATQALGYNAQWVTDWPAYHVDVIKFLGHNDKTQIAGFIHIGTAAEEPNERPRPDIKEIVSKFRV
tara:strand:+ start:1199 stop:1777 length:579 start_codon:yes stop_codon:yes gene_type:complete